MKKLIQLYNKCLLTSLTAHIGLHVPLVNFAVKVTSVSAAPLISQGSLRSGVTKFEGNKPTPLSPSPFHQLGSLKNFTKLLTFMHRSHRRNFNYYSM